MTVWCFIAQGLAVHLPLNPAPLILFYNLAAAIISFKISVGTAVFSFVFTSLKLLAAIFPCFFLLYLFKQADEILGVQFFIHLSIDISNHPRFLVHFLITITPTWHLTRHTLSPITRAQTIQDFLFAFLCAKTLLKMERDLI